MNCTARMFLVMMMTTTMLMMRATMRMTMMRMTKVFCAGCSGQLSFAPNTIVSAGAVAIVPVPCHLQTHNCAKAQIIDSLHYTSTVLCSCYSRDSVANCVEGNNELTDLGT